MAVIWSIFQYYQITFWIDDEEELLTTWTYQELNKYTTWNHKYFITFYWACKILSKGGIGNTLLEKTFTIFTFFM